MRIFAYCLIAFFLACNAALAESYILDSTAPEVTLVDGISNEGLGWSFSTSLSPTFNNDTHYALLDAWQAEWAFRNIATQTYTVYAIWFAHTSATQQAKYSLSDGGGDFFVDQTIAPREDIIIEDTKGNLLNFQALGTVTITDGTLDITLSHSDNGTKNLFVDAIALHAPEPATIGLLATGCIMMLARKKRRTSKKL